MNARIFLVALLSAVTALMLSMEASAEDACIRVAGQQLRPSDIYDTVHQCGTCPGQTAQLLLCQAINRVMVPYWGSPTHADLVAIPHRGYWGYPLGQGASENTQAAFSEALRRGYRVIEVDAALTGRDGNGNRSVFLGHYFNMAMVGGDRTKAPKDYTAAQLSQFKMNHRDQTPNSDNNAKLALMGDVIQWAKNNQVLLMIDPKIPGYAGPNDYEEIVARVLIDARQRGALGNIGIKTVDNYADAIAKMSPFISAPSYQADYAGRFLWSPIPETKPNDKTRTQVLGYIDNWLASTGNGKHIITIETGLFSRDYWTAKQFTTESHTTYGNLIDYVERSTRYGKRSALWSVDPMSPRGTLGRVYNWKFIGNTPDDQRGNTLVDLSYAFALFTAVNTDRPDEYKGYVDDPYHQ